MLLHGEEDIAAAYKQAIDLWSRDSKLHSLFRTQQELTHTIKEVYEDQDLVYEKCPLGDTEH